MKIKLNDKAKAFLRGLGLVYVVTCENSKILNGKYIADRGFLPSFVVKGLAPLLPNYTVRLMEASEDYPNASVIIHAISDKAVVQEDNLDD